MSILKKIALIYGVIIISKFFVSCCNCEDSMELRYTDNAILVNNLDNSGRIPILARTEGVIKTAYGIQLQVLSIEVARQNNWGFSTANAYSCGCKPPITYIPRDSIINFEIISVNPFDALPAGSDITDKFMVEAGNRFSAANSFLSGATPSVNYSLEQPRISSFLLMQPPATTGAYQFEIRLQLSDGRTLTQRTTPINLI